MSAEWSTQCQHVTGYLRPRFNGSIYNGGGAVLCRCNATTEREGRRYCKRHAKRIDQHKAAAAR